MDVAVAFDDEARRADRTQLILQAARKAIGEMRVRISANTSHIHQLTLDEEALDRLDQMYWDEVPNFKAEHKYPPGARIDIAKALGLTIFLMLTSREKIFLLQEGAQVERKWEWRCYLYFFNLLMMACLELNHTHLNHPPERQARYSSLRKLASDETPSKASLCWLCTYLEAMMLYGMATRGKAPAKV